MGINVSTQGVSGSHWAVARVAEIADDAASLVSRKVGRLPLVDIVVTNDIDRVMEDAERTIVRRSRRASQWEGRSLRDMYGATTISSRGSVVAINAGRHSEQAQLDATVVHELTHCAQHSRDRRLQVAIVKNNYKAPELSDKECARLSQQRNRDEHEARGMERLARKLK